MDIIIILDYTIKMNIKKINIDIIRSKSLRNDAPYAFSWHLARSDRSV